MRLKFDTYLVTAFWLYFYIISYTFYCIKCVSEWLRPRGGVVTRAVNNAEKSGND